MSSALPPPDADPAIPWREVALQAVADAAASRKRARTALRLAVVSFALSLVAIGLRVGQLVHWW
jgi:hypothetical protein